MKNFWNKHKKIIIIATMAVVLVIAGVLAVVGKNRNEPVEIAGAETQTEVETQTEEPATQKATEAPTEPEEKPFRKPLTGEPTDTDYSDIRPVAVMFNTIRQALPQSGNSHADIYIEIPEEGGITRVCGIYQDITGVGMLGSIRSTREYFLSFVRSFDAILAHAGSDSWVINETANSGYATMDALSNAYTAYWRDEDRLKDSSLEHSLVTSSDSLQEWLETSGIPKEHIKADNTVLEFTDEISDDMTGNGKTVTVNFSGYKRTTFKYNTKSGKYDVYFWENDEPYIDAENNRQIDVTNIIILPVTTWNDIDGWGVDRQKYDFSGGNGYYISGGKSMEITWSKGDYNKSDEYGNPLKLTDSNGNELKLVTGKTYICVLNKVNEVVIE